jgi:N-methylhydantoinase A/oxoprolinase/acetone carboxylase beta subunit
VLLRSAPGHRYRSDVHIGVDSGGTFTDVVGMDGRLLKIPSTPDDPGRAVLEGSARLSGARPALLAHGTTVATNALLQRRGARVALVTTAGFADVIEIARQHRPALYDPWADRPEPLVARHDRLEVDERLDAAGGVISPYRPGSVPEPPEGCDAVAVCLLHADLDPRHEELVGADLEARGWDVSLSSRVSPEFREYERTVTAVVNAFLRPVCRPYLDGLAGGADEVVVMTSAGGLVDVAEAAARPAALLLSGPAAGARAAAAVAAACGFDDAVSFDMGGTSTDVCLVLDGAPAPAAQHDVAGLPVRMPSLDVHTIGAGGGSIARLDAGGALVVGPGSAGAVPGPACYGRGGTEPTVTDADLVAGRIPTDAPFPGLGRLDRDAATAALAAAGVDAEGVIAVVTAGMEQAVRRVSVERGVDPARLALVAFGGAGPLHACDLADAVGIPVVVVPAAAGVLSAVGLLTSPRRRELVRSRPQPADHRGLERVRAALAEEAVAALTAGGVDAGVVEVHTAVDCRYAGQSHELTVADVADFAAEHRRRNGYERPGDPIEVVAVRAVAAAPAPAAIEEVLAGWDGRWSGPVEGPQVVVRDDCSIWVPAGWRGEPGPLGSLVLRRVGVVAGRGA